MTKMRDADIPLPKRIELAIERIANGQAAMRVPVEATDPDMVLADCAKRIAELEAENKTLRAAQKACEACDEGLFAESEAIRAERDALRADAERYRWLRVKGYLALPELMDADDILHVTHKLDDAIDAARGNDGQNRVRVP